MRSLLEKYGAVVAGRAATAADAEQLILEEAPQLAVVHVKLRGEMAFDLIDRLHDGGISVVLTSGYLLPQARLETSPPPCRSPSAKSSS